MAGWRAIPDSVARDYLHQLHQPWTKEQPIPKEQAMLEACLLLVIGMRGRGERDLAERWGRSRNFVRQILKTAEAEMASAEVPGRKVPAGTTGAPSHGATKSEQERQDTREESTKKVPEEYQKGTSKDDRARSICRVDEIRADQTPPSPNGDCPPTGQEGEGQQEEHTEHHTPQPAMQPEPMKTQEPDSEVYANPHRLARVWAEELQASPAALRGGHAGTGARGSRGRSIGLTPVWPAELLEAGPAQAEVAVRAVAELCRGTGTRAPRVLEWADFFGDRARFPSAWRDALAWKVGEAGEPALGRQYVKPDKGGGRAVVAEVKGDPMASFYTGET